MEREHPERYCRQLRIHVAAEFEDAIARLAEEFADSPELFERICRALTGAEHWRDVGEDLLREQKAKIAKPSASPLGTTGGEDPEPRSEILSVQQRPAA